MSNALKTLLITGATGKQGGAVIDALLASPTAKFYPILALTRNPSSASATALARKSQTIKLIEGDLNDCPAIFRAANTPIWGVFSVQLPYGRGASPEIEERQGKALVDAALAHDAKHFVYASVERHGARSDTDPTNVPHFISKFNIEKHLERQTAANGSKMTYTILRPVPFMENMSPDFMGKMFAAMWKSALAPEKKIQLISTADIGYLSAQAFIHPDDPLYKNTAFSVAGDELTYDEAGTVYKKVVGSDMPSTFGFLGQALMWSVGDMGTMFRWINNPGFGADIAAVRKMHPRVMSFADWVGKKENGHVKA